ncbi:SH3 domain-containing protein [Streptacidiphilus sp. P02-A3a]|uniref:SH3 domain-containing protein n=1 Tax=Streptacidiphilus sp. P02-A3a TaxID=2704468 RepID=UPI0015F8AB71|nr:SH3 domain-containing protein [Streptacidiphilus sp. P02-A3a]QMU67823.1 SH3 domain-containing protein [Streptacidiphilus sp. P02-A3a]
MSDFRPRSAFVPVLGAAAVAALTVAALAVATAAPAVAAARPHQLHARASRAREPRALPLHARPSDGSAVVGRLARGDRFTTRQSDGGWTFIHDRTTRAEGWALFAHPHHTAPGPHYPGHD